MQYATELELHDLCHRVTDAIDLRIHSHCRTLLKRKTSSEPNALPKNHLGSN